MPKHLVLGSKMSDEPQEKTWLEKLEEIAEKIYKKIVGSDNNGEKRQ